MEHLGQFYISRFASGGSVFGQRLHRYGQNDWVMALGRKNFLFAGSDAGGDRAAAIYSLLGSAKLNGLDPEAYLRFVIERIADYSIHKLDDLLPWHVAEQFAKTEHHAAA